MTATGSSPGSLRKSFTFAAGALALIACAAALASPAQAGDWSFDGGVNNSIEIFDNYGLLPKSKGVVIRDSLGASGNFAYTTHTSRFGLSTSIVANGYAGSGADDLKNNIFPKIGAKYQVDRKRTSFNFGANYSYAFLPANDEIDPDTGLLVEGDPSERHAFSASFGVQHKLDKLNTLSYSASTARNIYTGAGADNFSFNNSWGWSHILNQRVSTNLGLGLKYNEVDDATKSETIVYSANAGLSAKLTKRLSTSVGGGVNVLSSEKGNLLLPGTPRTNTTTIGYSANAGFQYSLKTLTLGGNASYGLQGTTLGGYQNSLAFSLNASQVINQRSSISAVASAQFSSAAGKGADSTTTARYTFGPTYSYKLAKDWDLTAGYKFTFRDAAVNAKAHNAFVSVAWKFKVK